MKKSILIFCIIVLFTSIVGSIIVNAISNEQSSGVSFSTKNNSNNEQEIFVNKEKILNDRKVILEDENILQKDTLQEDILFNKTVVKSDNYNDISVVSLNVQVFKLFFNKDVFEYLDEKKIKVRNIDFKVINTNNQSETIGMVCSNEDNKTNYATAINFIQKNCNIQSFFLQTVVFECTSELISDIERGGKK